MLFAWGVGQFSQGRGFQEACHVRERHDTLLWMKDLIEHMAQCQEQLQWNAEGPGARFLTEAIRGDLTECLRLCDRLGPAGRPQMSAAGAH